MSSQASSSGRMAKEDLPDKKKDSKTKEIDKFFSYTCFKIKQCKLHSSQSRYNTQFPQMHNWFVL